MCQIDGISGGVPNFQNGFSCECIFRCNAARADTIKLGAVAAMHTKYASQKSYTAASLCTQRAAVFAIGSMSKYAPGARRPCGFATAITTATAATARWR